VLVNTTETIDTLANPVFLNNLNDLLELTNDLGSKVFKIIEGTDKPTELKKTDDTVVQDNTNEIDPTQDNLDTVINKIYDWQGNDDNKDDTKKLDDYDSDPDFDIPEYECDEDIPDYCDPNYSWELEYVKPIDSQIIQDKSIPLMDRLHYELISKFIKYYKYGKNINRRILRVTSQVLANPKIRRFSSAYTVHELVTQFINSSIAHGCSDKLIRSAVMDDLNNLKSSGQVEYVRFYGTCWTIPKMKKHLIFPERRVVHAREGLTYPYYFPVYPKLSEQIQNDIKRIGLGKSSKSQYTNRTYTKTDDIIDTLVTKEDHDKKMNIPHDTQISKEPEMDNVRSKKVMHDVVKSKAVNTPVIPVIEQTPVVHATKKRKPKKKKKQTKPKKKKKQTKTDIIRQMLMDGTSPHEIINNTETKKVAYTVKILKKVTKEMDIEFTYSRKSRTKKKKKKAVVKPTIEDKKDDKGDNEP
jgi:hypothetical protein